MARYATAEVGSYHPTDGAIEGEAAASSSNSDYIVIRFTGLPTNRDSYPIAANLIMVATAPTASVNIDVFVVPNAFQTIPAINVQKIPNPKWRFEGFLAGSFTIPLGLNISILPLDATVLAQGWALPTYDNKKALTLIVQKTTTAGLLDLTVSSLRTTEVSGRTGLVGSQYIKDWNSRTGTGGLVCPKTGQWIARNEAVRDGYLGVLVAPESYDPPEPKQLPQTWRSGNRGDIRDDRDDL